jgi:CDP-diacylglycerol--serine O-phosphatidyltransferase
VTLFFQWCLVREEVSWYVNPVTRDSIFARCQAGVVVIVKKIAILPTLLTLGNGICGFAAIAYASKIGPQSTAKETDDLFFLSACLILLAMFFDALDGYVARLSKSASDFGGQLDSLCDAISFGAAPGFLLLRLGREWERHLIGSAVAMIAALYMVCAVLRLARFNTENTPDPTSHKRFKGLPSPAAAGCVVSLVILRSAPSELGGTGVNAEMMQAFVRVWAPLGTLIAALLMVSRASYPHVTKQILHGRRPFSVIVQLVLALFIIALTPHLAFFLLFWGYAFSGLIRHVLFRVARRKSSLTDLESAREPGIDH